MKIKLEAARKAAMEAKTAFDANPTAETAAAVEDASAKFVELDELAKRAAKSASAMGHILDGDGVEDGLGQSRDSRHGLASKFIDSAEYKAFRAGAAGAPSNSERQVQLPSVKLGSYLDVIEAKAGNALTTAIAHPVAQTFPMVDQVVRDELTLMDLITKGRIDSEALRYVQVVSVERNAALQPENTGDSATDTLKPISKLSTNIETASVFGYADGYEVTTQMLSDASAFATFMDNELRYSIRRVQERYLLNGSGANGEPRGILNTTGIQGLTYDGSGGQPVRALVEKVRTALRKISEVGGTTTAILLHPEDNEAIDLMTDANQNYVFGGPANVGVQTLWGRPRVVSDQVEKGTVLLGDFKQVAYLDRDGISVEAFNQHKDFAQRNLVYVRAEARGLQVIWRPSRLALIEKA